MTMWLASCALAAMLGFAAHRATVCTVRAVAELLSTGRMTYFVSFAKSAAWTLAIVLPLLWSDGNLALAVRDHQMSWISMAGGFVFGLGAAFNRACAFSTLARLVDGDLRMLVTLAAFTLGVLISILALSWGYLPRPAPALPLIHQLLAFAGVLSLALIGWGVFEFSRIWAIRPSGKGALQLATLPQYRLSTAAMFMGLANGALYLMHGSWAYTGYLHRGLEGLVTHAESPPLAKALLVLALIAGMAGSTWQRGGFALNWKPQCNWMNNAVGGACMGIGAALIPGGNDSLVLFSIPMLAAHAVPAYGAMLVGIGLAIQGMNWMTGSRFVVECKDDICLSVGTVTDRVNRA